MAEQEAYNTPQSYEYTYTITPDALELVPDSNIDIRLASGTWSYDVQAVKDGEVVELTPEGGKPVNRVEIQATNAQVAAGLEAAGIADGAGALVKLRQALLKVAKAKLT